LLTDPTEELLISLFHQDHFRFHCLAPGQSLLEQLIPLLKLAQEVEEHYPFSKSEKGDYLCARAEEAGLALRASLMAQFIMLQELEELDPHIFQLMKKGYSLRGFTDNRDEDSQSSLGGFYQIYSQARGAEDPQEVLNTMLMDLDPLIQRERDLRQELKQGRFPWVEDRINRSFGILKYCKLISSNEAQKRLSYIRLGVTLGWIDGLSLQEVSAMQILVQDRHICAGFNQAEPGPFALDEERARFIREVFERGLPYRR
jgi:protein arginine kinase